jgi:hypothetical protein
MGWLKNRLMRGASNRAHQRLAYEFGAGPGTGTLALAMGYACYPKANYGDRGFHDAIIQQLRQFPSRPCDANSARSHLEAWLDRGVVSTTDVFTHIWGMEPQGFLAKFFDSCG